MGTGLENTRKDYKEMGFNDRNYKAMMDDQRDVNTAAAKNIETFRNLYSIWGPDIAEWMKIRPAKYCSNYYWRVVGSVYYSTNKQTNATHSKVRRALNRAMYDRLVLGGNRAGDTDAIDLPRDWLRVQSNWPNISTRRLAGNELFDINMHVGVHGGLQPGPLAEGEEDGQPDSETDDDLPSPAMIGPPPTRQALHIMYPRTSSKNSKDSNKGTSAKVSKGSNRGKSIGGNAKPERNVFIRPGETKRTDSGLVFNPTGGDTDFELAPIPAFLECQCSSSIQNAIQFQYDLMKTHDNNLEMCMGLLGVLGNVNSAFLCREHLGVLGGKLGLEVITVPSNDLNPRIALFWQHRSLGGTAAKEKIQQEHPDWFLPATPFRNTSIFDHGNPAQHNRKCKTGTRT
ncbi:hypothetical protein MMC31_005950 [Peltigera leucophlebia]|nr:hypothetical protein [Peltigera leucophlebia]